MDKVKEKLLFETAERFFSSEIESMKDFCAKDLIVFGTSIDEEVYTLKNFQDYRRKFKASKKDVKIETNRKLIFHKVNSVGNAALFIYEIHSNYSTAGIETSIFKRVTMGIEFENDKWEIVHVHFSKVNEDQEADDPFHFFEIKKKNEELQKLVEEKTADLVKKNKYLEIEASLERVRTVSMSMKNPDDLLEICEVLFKELHSLGFNELRNAMINIFNDDKETFVNYDFSDVLGKSITPLFYNIHPIIRKQIRQVRKSKDAYTETVFSIKDLADWKKFRKSRGEKDDPRLKKAKALHYYFYSVGTAAIGISTFSRITDEKKKLLKRFRNVFDFAYRRYMDVTQAEAQTKEAQIEAALERVRSRTMSMQKSEELKEVIQVIYEQFVHLNINIDHAGIIMDYKERDDMNIWVSDHRGAISQVAIPYFDTEHWNRFNEAKRKGKDFFAVNLTFKEKNIFYKKLFKFIPGLPEEAKEFYFSCPGLAISTVLLDNVSLYIENFSGIPYTDEENATLMRFGKVFQQTYTRFLDLQKAEAQAKEAQIEASLEKVRGKAMAMHSSSDLTDAAGTVFTELSKLGIKPIRSGFVLLSKDSRKAKLYPATTFDNKNTVSLTGEFEFTGHLVYEKQYDSWQKKENYFPELDGDLLKSYYKILAEGLSVPYENFPTDKKQFGTFLPFSEGFLFTWSDEPYSENEIDILDRFKNILDLTIRRYIDLKNAEAQSKEAKIEAALERVRSRTMAMHHSEELEETARVLLAQLKIFGIDPVRSYIAIMPDVIEENTKGTIDIYGSGAENEILNIQIARDIGLQKKIYSGWVKKSKSLILNSKGKESEGIAYFSKGFIGITASDEPSEDIMNLLERFAGVFDLTYTRFLDLQKAEAQAREAQIEAALERVRSRTLAMQRSDELAETAAVLFKQLINLGIEPNRLYIGIINDDSGDIEAWATDEDGSKVSTEFTLNIHANASVKKMYDGWAARKKSIIIDMHGKELEEYFHYLNNVLNVPFKVGLSHDRRVQNIAYFSKGFIGMSKGYIGMASPDPQPEETAILLERFAAVFNLTFTRFNDLQIAEKHAEQAELDLIKLQTEKKRAEEALTELRSTQAQLIQSEKMASLGELTAGIAHEIQNPLNFVNNFSEVNTELIDELNQEIAKGNFDEAVLIAKDIKDNEEKIKHHGKRAEGIVKGMLQHSRSSSSVKEPVSINSLADEYLRLAFHGLRAKDKTFNAKMETHFDESIGEINIVPQEIGRVILNLITNAFYAVTEKKKEGIKDYDPTVKVSTKKSDGKVLVSVQDNGNGIPQKVMDKIFQPFFTTKPTGQGTGLGLSMSYDIVKAHGGELEVETRKGEGSEFIISIPV